MMLLGKKGSAPSWLAVCLGNPGTKYSGTRHNAGFMVADVISSKYNVQLNRLRFKALTGTINIGGETVLVMKPQTYMNLSGEAVIQASRFYKIPPERIIVVSDEMSLPIGKIRVRPKGSSGGHNGLKNIILQLGTEEFPRIRIGVGAPPHPDYDMKDWALSTFRNQDAEDIHDAVVKAADAVESYIKYGAEKTMSNFN